MISKKLTHIQINTNESAEIILKCRECESSFESDWGEEPAEQKAGCSNCGAKNSFDIFDETNL